MSERIENPLFNKPFSEIKNPAILDLPRRLRLPRLGKIRLGKVVRKGITGKCQHPANDYCFNCSYPTDEKFFICPPEVIAKYGAEPTELPVMFPTDSLQTIFPHCLKWYGKTGLKCRGDGEQAERYDEKAQQFVKRECPCEEYEAGHCGLRGTLFVILYEINMAGVYQVVTGSSNSVTDIVSGIKYHQEILERIGTTIALKPLILKREQMDTTYVNKAGDRKKSVHYPLKITSKLTMENLIAYQDKMRLTGVNPNTTILLPIINENDDNPLADKGAVIVDEKEITDMADNGNGQAEAKPKQEAPPSVEKPKQIEPPKPEPPKTPPTPPTPPQTPPPKQSPPLPPLKVCPPKTAPPPPAKMQGRDDEPQWIKDERAKLDAKKNNGGANGGQARGATNDHTASVPQKKMIYAIFGKNGLGVDADVRDLYINEHFKFLPDFEDPIETLSIKQASEMINILQDIQANRREISYDPIKGGGGKCRLVVSESKPAKTQPSQGNGQDDDIPF